MKTIRETADLFDVSTRTIRYYEEIGLLSPARSEGNQRLYPASELVKLKLIVRGKKYGFSLEEIKEMVLLFDKDRTGRKQLERTIQYGRRRIEEVELKIQELEEMKREMEQLLVVFNSKLEKSKGDEGNE
ncbi:MerR family DNA-binding transcriptional regulator [Mammaliicoccus sciuri]|uniref:DNA-binding transcriptional regulator, MerR family n=2 Tax=Sporosarcina newyorkensis TaxID=759851 RepID=A0A1T4XZM0_9BACL|nr:MerR family DNA-binding transcriptional regulator [Sporosarcina newyorkensis]EGQ26858.1 MerR family transcriptional regulator [Sporosarcina newyorkensis 2681]MBY0221538.1 MerR family DNA-binding transcriptional regulator [Sporosarcina aquimarina]SKA95027.1 DNA-binding transcriptional regulator, MerR family [Sporosarcina newyorkensis]